MYQSAAKSRFVLAYDSDCGPCTAFRQLVSFLDPRGRIECLSLSEADREGLLDPVSPSSRYASAHLVLPDGGVLSGATAIPKILELLPGGLVTSTMLGKWGPGRRFSSFVYSTASGLHNSGLCKNDAPGFQAKS